MSKKVEATKITIPFDEITLNGMIIGQRALGLKITLPEISLRCDHPLTDGLLVRRGRSDEYLEVSLKIVEDKEEADD